MEQYQRVYITQDNDGHDYVIPYELRGQFNELLEESNTSDMAEDIFNDMFSNFMTGGDINETELYQKIK